MTGATIRRNIFYSSGAVTEFINELAPGKESSTEDSRGRQIARSKEADCDYNIYYSQADRGSGEAALKKQQGDGVDLHSLATDPLFVNPKAGDFRFRPDSPALKMGIVPIDLSKIGLRK
jgi:hypothetical protein